MNRTKRLLLIPLVAALMLLFGMCAMASTLTMPSKIKMPANGAFDLSAGNAKPTEETKSATGGASSKTCSIAAITAVIITGNHARGIRGRGRRSRGEIIRSSGVARRSDRLSGGFRVVNTKSIGTKFKVDRSGAFIVALLSFL